MKQLFSRTMTLSFDCSTRRLWSLTLFLLGTGWLIQGCYYDNELDLYGISTPCDTLTISYNNKVKAIFDTQCLSCHKRASASGNLNLESDSVRKAQIVTILDRINRPAGDPKLMPTSGPMSNCNLLSVRAWYHQGLSTTN